MEKSVASAITDHKDVSMKFSDLIYSLIQNQRWNKDAVWDSVFLPREKFDVWWEISQTLQTCTTLWTALPMTFYSYGMSKM